MRILFVVYDNGSYISEFPMGLAQLTSVLENAGHEVDLYLQDIHHYPEEHLKAYLDKNAYDMVGLSFIGGYWQYHKAKKISESINTSKNRPALYALGGHGPSPEPEFFCAKWGLMSFALVRERKQFWSLQRGKNYLQYSGLPTLMRQEIFLSMSVAHS